MHDIIISALRHAGARDTDAPEGQPLALRLPTGETALVIGGRVFVEADAAQIQAPGHADLDLLDTITDAGYDAQIVRASVQAGTYVRAEVPAIRVTREGVTVDLWWDDEGHCWVATRRGETHEVYDGRQHLERLLEER